MWALRALGVRQVFAPCAVGSLTPELEPGAIVVPDQLVDRTRRRADTYFDSGAAHASFADPYCPTLRSAVTGLPGVVDGGTMVVIEGPRFSTRAESQWFAAAGFTLINMTGYPEAVLARELEICYATIALVTDLDAGIDAGAGVKVVDVIGEFEKNIEPFKKLVREAIGQVACRTHLRRVLVAHRHRAAVRPAVRVLLTGAAGFIGSRVDAALRAAGHDVVAVDAMLPAAHGDDAALPRDCRRVDIRDADALAPLLDGVDLVCHQAAVVGAGVNAADAPDYGSHNDFGTTVLLAQMFHAGVTRLVLASSMVVYGQGRYRCDEHGPVDPLPRRRADLDAGVFEHRCPVGGEELAWQLVDEDAPLRPRSLYAASKTAQEHYALAWSESTGGSVVALRYHNVYGPDMPRDTPYSGVAAIFRSATRKGPSAKGFRRWRPDAGLRSRRRRRGGQRGGGGRRPRRVHRRECLLRDSRFPSWRWRRSCAKREIPRCRRLSPANTAAATCAISSPIRPAPPTCWVSGRWSSRGKDCATSRSRRCAVSESYSGS